MHKKLSIVTIFYDDGRDDLIKTYQSIVSQSSQNYELIIVASNVSDTDCFKSNFKNEKVFFILNEDTSLYNAMNLGLNAAKGNLVLFLNAGDLFYDNGSIQKILSNDDPNKCQIFKCNQIFMEASYTRPNSFKNINSLFNVAPHQSFIAPLPQAKNFLFDESKYIVSDYLWMKELIKAHGFKYYDDVISCFSLGGISSKPNIKSVYYWYKDLGFFAGVRELFKMIIYNSIGPNMYYRLSFSSKSFIFKFKDKV
tara:strand:+ start:41 stop:799 length:759 start_codon:yes stop_codon:yes gene_type:complete